MADCLGSLCHGRTNASRKLSALSFRAAPSHDEYWAKPGHGHNARDISYDIYAGYASLFASYFAYPGGAAYEFPMTVRGTSSSDVLACDETMAWPFGGWGSIDNPYRGCHGALLAITWVSRLQGDGSVHGRPQPEAQIRRHTTSDAYRFW